MITSAQNTQVKNIIKLNQKAKARREQKLFVAEGRKMFLEAPENLIDRIYVAESMLEDEEVMQKVHRFSWEAVENSVFRQMCDTDSAGNSYSSQTAVLSDGGSSQRKKSADHGSGGSSGSRQCRNDHKNR